MALTGAKAHIARLKRLQGNELDRRITAALFAAGQKIQVEAQLSITRGAVSGKNHVPSKPGEPPNADTHHLADNIETAIVEEGLVQVTSNARYAARLEFGDSKVAARPYMRPAREKMRPLVEKLIIKAVKSVVSGRGGRR